MRAAVMRRKVALPVSPRCPVQKAKGRAESDWEVEPALIELAKVSEELDEQAAFLGAELIEPGGNPFGWKP